MTTAPPAPHHLGQLTPRLDEVPGQVSVWCGHPGHQAAYSRLPNLPHYAASTMKVAVMIAAYRLADAGLLDLDDSIYVHSDFSSVSGHGEFTMNEAYDGDDQPWARIGEDARLRWLIRRMIVSSSNLATNLVLERTGNDAVSEAWELAGARHSSTPRGIEDYQARDIGMDNLVTAEDLALLLGSIVSGFAASGESCEEMLDVLFHQEKNVDVATGLPEGTRIAHKNGWIDGIRHSAAYVVPADAKPYLVVTCVTTDPAGLDQQALHERDAILCQVIREVAAASWADRHHLGRAHR